MTQKECCPCCKSTEFKVIGSAFDGINANVQYQCKQCNNEWES